MWLAVLALGVGRVCSSRHRRESLDVGPHRSGSNYSLLLPVVEPWTNHLTALSLSDFIWPTTKYGCIYFGVIGKWDTIHVKWCLAHSRTYWVTADWLKALPHIAFYHWQHFLFLGSRIWKVFTGVIDQGMYPLLHTFCPREEEPFISDIVQNCLHMVTVKMADFLKIIKNFYLLKFATDNVPPYYLHPGRTAPTSCLWSITGSQN